jgi:hypothetical protein
MNSARWARVGRSVTRRRTAIWAFAVVLSLLLLPTAAMAKPGSEVIKAERLSEIRLIGSHGYRIRIEVRSAANADGGFNGSDATAFIAATKGIYRTAYEVEGVRLESDGGIRIRIPGAGLIDLSFKPRRAGFEPGAPYCQGGRTRIEHGIFRGVFTLRGRRGFTSVRRTAVAGRFVELPRTVCNSGSREANAATAHEAKDRHSSPPGAQASRP